MTNLRDTQYGIRVAYPVLRIAMFIFQVHHYIKPDMVEAYREATLENARLTIQEEGVWRFDFFQDAKDPTHFSLFEVYKDLEARDKHLETAHFLKWKDVCLQTCERRGDGDEFNALFSAESKFAPHQKSDTPKRLNVSSGAKWEDIVGYCRAVRVGNTVEVAGTAAVDDSGTVVGETPYEQTKFILQKIERALNQTGASMSDVIRTRTFVTDIAKWEEVGRAHGEFFRDIKPVATMVEVSALIDEKLMVEIEVTAAISR